MSTTTGTAPATTGANAGTAVAPANNALAAKSKEMVESVMHRVEEMEQAGQLMLPANYAAGNALRLAWLHLQNVTDKNGNRALDVCTTESVANALLEMVIKGETVGKSQCYFIPTGNKLTFWEDYRGKLMRAKRDTEIAKVNPQVIYAKDNFVYTVDEDGEMQLVKHETCLANINPAEIVGAYAVVINKDNTRHLEVMTMDMIKASWGQGAAKGNSMAHTKFSDQMCKKTVIARACKIALGSSDDSELEKNDLQRPDEAGDTREEAQQQVQHLNAPAFEDAEYEDVTGTANAGDKPAEAIPAQPAKPASKPASKPAGKKKNECPI